VENNRFSTTARVFGASIVGDAIGISPRSLASDTTAPGIVL